MFEKLAEVFDAVAAKHLKAVDVKRSRSNKKGSNQHEIGGLKSAGLGDFLGYPENGDKLYIPTSMVYLSDDCEKAANVLSQMSWYDTRYDDPKRGEEYRLYYQDNEITERMSEGDFLLLALTKGRELLMVVAPHGSLVEKQLRALFGTTAHEIGGSLKKVPIDEMSITIPVVTMLAQLGIELFTPQQDDNEKLGALVSAFGLNFPSTREFSDFARKTSDQVDPIKFPDETLLSWMEQEEHLFKLLERRIVEERLDAGFGNSGKKVDDFIKFSLSVQNRRKSRVGHAFEHHIEKILEENRVRFDRSAKTEGKQTPDFLFPGEREYHAQDFDSSKLRMLGAKTTCKDRWRQVLAEAKSISRKHLITIEPAISSDQTSQMRELSIQLVVPTPIQSTYSSQQREWLMSFENFIFEVKGI